MNWLISQPNIYDETITINDLDLLQGDSHLSDKKNKQLFDAVFKYIHDSKRFI